MNKKEIIDNVVSETNWTLLRNLIWQLNKTLYGRDDTISPEELKELGTDLLTDLLDMPQALEVGSKYLTAYKISDGIMFKGYGIKFQVVGGTAWTGKINEA